jgi:hypothetical protein
LSTKSKGLKQGVEQAFFPFPGIPPKGAAARGLPATAAREGVEQGVGLAFSHVSQAHAHWLRFYADAKAVAGFSPHHHLHKKPLPQAHHLPPQPTKAAARVGARVGRAFLPTEMGRRLFAISPFAPKNSSREHTSLPHHHHQEDQASSKQRARG